MAYQAQKPQPTDVKSQSQADILGNFQALSPFGNGFADFTVKVATPAITATDTGLYTRSNATTTQNEMYIQKRTNNADVQVPMTASSMNNVLPATDSVGWTYLPSGILMKWGKKAITNSLIANTIDIDTISGGPAFTRVFSVQLTAYDSLNYISTSANLSIIVSGSDVRVWLNTGSATTGAYYFAIGV